VTADAYSPLKAVRHLDVIQGVRDARPVRPVHVQLILSDLCNQSCTFCSYRDPAYTSSQLFYEIKKSGAGLRRDEAHPERNYNPNRMIDFEKVEEIVDDCARMGVSGIQFTGGGEPTVHPKFADALFHAQSKGIATSLVTNGVLVGKNFDKWRNELMCLRWIRFSLDAATLKTYTDVRHVPDWHFTSALAGIRQLRDLRDHRGASGPIIGVGFVVTPDNWTEVYEACVLARDSGADNIRISAQFSADDEKKFESFYKECAGLCQRAEREITSKSFTVYNRFGQKLDDLRQKAPDYDACGYQHVTTYIGADLNVYRCCVLAYNERGVVGSLKEQSLRHLWMSQRRVDEMNQFDARGCERCQFNTINKNLEYMLSDKDPAHSEFV
jgi:MoaA/NifB/PqqE/SkfB family radical SAM enzyme